MTIHTILRHNILFPSHLRATHYSFLLLRPSIRCLPFVPPLVNCGTPFTLRDVKTSFSKTSTVSLPFSFTFLVVIFRPLTTLVDVDVDLNDPKKITKFQFCYINSK